MEDAIHRGVIGSVKVGRKRKNIFFCIASAIILLIISFLFQMQSEGSFRKGNISPTRERKPYVTVLTQQNFRHPTKQPSKQAERNSTSWKKISSLAWSHGYDRRRITLSSSRQSSLPKTPSPTANCSLSGEALCWNLTRN